MTMNKLVVNFISFGILISILTSCKYSSFKKSPANNQEEYIDVVRNENVYRKDSISIDVRIQDFNYVFFTTVGNTKHCYDLAAMGIPTKSPDEIEWINKDYAAMMVWWSAEFNNYIFLPIDKKNKFFFINETIIASDSINNNIAYIDTVYQDKFQIQFQVQNLLSGKHKSVVLTYKDTLEIFPKFSIEFRKHQVTVSNETEKKVLEISDIY